jgi:outer membrane lipoprotein-sorting protein
MRKLVLILVVFSFASVSLASAENTQAQRQKQEQTSKHERIVEEVEVINFEVPVRVFYKKKPVKGLKKSDFKLYLDGEERPINGFYEVRRKLDPQPQYPEHVVRDRLFVLIFNVSSSSRDLEKGMQYFFKQVIQPHDRLMVLTNNVFLQERVVENPQKELEKLLKILKLEARKTTFKLSSLESSLRSLASQLKYELKNLGLRSPESAIRRFLTNYKDYYSEFKTIFFNPPEEQYIKVAEYLKHQQVEKWVIHFYQIPQFPQLKISGGVLYKAINKFFQSRRLPNPYITDIQPIMGMPGDPDFIRNINKLFLNTGATFHTLLLKSWMPEYFEELDYRPVSTDSEHIFRQVTRLSHGSVMASNNMEKFVERIFEKEDVYYMLTYAPKKDSRTNKNKGKINVMVTHKKYRKARTTYDNQQRTRYLRKTIRKIKKKVPHIRIQSMELKDGILSTFISGVLLAQDPEGRRGKILLTVKLLSENAVLISSTQKAFIAKNSEFPLSIRLPGLKKGSYKLMIEVHDLNTGRNDLELKDLNNPKDYKLEPGQVPFQFIKVPVLRPPGATTSTLNTPADITTDNTIEELSTFDEIQTDPALLEEFKSKEGIDQTMLPGILKKVAAYCQQLEAVSLNFFCIEDIHEKILNTLQRRGKILKEKTENIKRLTYGYQLIRDKNKIREKRILLRQNGWKRMKENAELKTRFKYKNIVYGPSIFNKQSQSSYQYRIIGKRNWNNRNLLIVEAVPNSMQEQRFAAGRIWVDENDYSILRIEIYQQSIGNFAEIERVAEKYQVEPHITIINEYDIVKNGIHFPSRVYFEEAYKDEKGKYIIQSQVNVTFSDYRFYTVETKVTY